MINVYKGQVLYVLYGRLIKLILSFHLVGAVEVGLEVDTVDAAAAAAAARVLAAIAVGAV